MCTAAVPPNASQALEMLQTLLSVLGVLAPGRGRPAR